MSEFIILKMTAILTGFILLILVGIVIYLYIMHKYLDKNDIVDYIAQIFKISEANLKQDLYLFLEEVKEEYYNHQKEIIQLLKQQQEETEKLKKVIINEATIFKEYCQERINTQEQIVKQIENRLQESQKHIAKLENMLSKCRKKVERLKNEN